MSDPEPREQLRLGMGAEGEAVELPARALLRHMMALGSSGSGKTVLCKVVAEEAVLSGIPVLCIDPQGDLCSLLASGDPAVWAERGLDPELGRRFSESADVVVFTPGSQKAVPLCADPIDADLAGLDQTDRLQALSRTAAVLVSLLGYDVDSDDGAGLSAVLDAVLGDALAAGRPLRNLGELSDELTKLSEAGFKNYARLLSAKKIQVACQRLARLDVGARRLMFHDGVPIDVDVLLGRGPGALPGKTRVSVIYLNTLGSQEDKEFFIASIVDRLYSWMLKHPSSTPQALFYIDEVAPFIPPVRKPACKDGLSLLFKQARKYGVACLMATQNPGDVDYKAMAQFGTWALGRLTTKQDLKKIEPTVKALAPQASEAIIADMPALRPGQFVLLSPDHFEHAVRLSSRWLFSKHETYDEDRLSQLADQLWRDRFKTGRGAAAASDEPEPESAPPQARRAPLPAAPARSSAVASEGQDDDSRDAERITPIPPTLDDPSLAPAPLTQPLPTPPADLTAISPLPVIAPAPAPAPAPAKTDTKQAALDDYARRLERQKSVSAKEFAALISAGEKKARGVLSELVERGLAAEYREGRSRRYYSVARGARPDLGLSGSVRHVLVQFDRARAAAIAGEHLRSKLFGLLGDDEVLDDVELGYRLLYRVDFEERVARPLLGRLLGQGDDQRLGSVYVHPHTLLFLVYTPAAGVLFSANPAEYASDVQDLDGVAAFAESAPSSLPIAAADFSARRSAAEVKQRFTQQFAATPRGIEPLLFPVYRFHIKLGGGKGYRVVCIDGLAGRPVEWPDPV